MKFSWIVVLAMPVSIAQAADPVHEAQDPDSGLTTWEWQAEGIKLQHVQRLPDQTRAFFLGRGFERDDADYIAASCVFQSVFYNLGPQAVSIDLAEWRFTDQDSLKPLKLTTDWQQDWEARNSPQAARIAFQWALFPNQQSFAPGDWNMGMITYPIPPGKTLDLHFVWHREGVRHQAVLPGLRCADKTTVLAPGE